jgi:excinuclease UvrABC ATPase subunit
VRSPQGPPEDVAASPSSHTGRYLQRALEAARG